MTIGMGRILAFPRSKSGICDLTLNKIEHFSKVSMSVGYRYLSLSDFNNSRVTAPDLNDKENFKRV